MPIYDVPLDSGYRLNGMPRPSERESTRLWLMDIDSQLQKMKLRLEGGYPRSDIPDHVASAVDLIEQAQEQLARERSELDAIGRGE